MENMAASRPWFLIFSPLFCFQYQDFWKAVMIFHFFSLILFQNHSFSFFFPYFSQSSLPPSKNFARFARTKLLLNIEIKEKKLLQNMGGGNDFPPKYIPLPYPIHTFSFGGKKGAGWEGKYIDLTPSQFPSLQIYIDRQTHQRQKIYFTNCRPVLYQHVGLNKLEFPKEYHTPVLDHCVLCAVM